MTASVPFDRAAEEYDRTRTITPEASAGITRLVIEQTAGRAPCLEIGVGTGLVALPLHDAGVPVVGLDLSLPMLAKLVQKTGGAPPFPLIRGDAAMLPFLDNVFGGALARHVLHLIDDWRAAVAELVRVVRPGGIVLLNIGVTGGRFQEVSDHLEALVGAAAQRVGLQPDQAAELDEVLGSFGARFRALPPVWQESHDSIGTYLAEVSAGVQSWTWTVDPDALASAVEQTRGWARERFGDLDLVLEPRSPIVFRAYDLA